MFGRGLRWLHGSFLADHRRIALAPLLASSLAPGWRVLDVGCGDGRMAQAVADRLPLDLVGVDVVEPKQAPPFPFEPYDGRTLPFGPASFDGVLLVDVLHHADDPLRLMREAARVARYRVTVKEHHLEGRLDRMRLVLMDWVGNRGYGVRLPYDYRPRSAWHAVFGDAGLRLDEERIEVDVYPGVLGRLLPPRLHFVAALRPDRDDLHHEGGQ